MTNNQLKQKLKKLDEKYAYPLLDELMKLKKEVNKEDVEFYLKCMIEDAHHLSRACEFWHCDLERR